MGRRVWFTGDTHFDHAEIIGFCGRPFGNVAEMNAGLVARWNAVVGVEDVVWHLGDFCVGAAGRHLARLHGVKHLIWGNHDDARCRAQAGWASSSPWAEIVVEDRRIVLCHYAMRTWPGASDGALQFFGHTHGTLAGNRQSCDVGVDVWGYQPRRLGEIVARLAGLPRRVLV